MLVSTAELAPDIPQDLIIDILLRLPAKSVGKFRCVSKPWRSLLSDPVFIKAHLTLHLHHPQKFILVSSSPHTQKSTLSTLSFSPTGGADYAGVSKKLTLLENQLAGVHILGSCNGLVLVSEFTIWNPYRQIGYLINPTTMELVELPANPVAPLTGRSGDWLTRRSGIAFGYDRSNDDYKIVMFFGRERGASDAYLDVFSLRRGAWRRIDVLCNLPVVIKGVFLNGALHWLMKFDGSLIMAFDLSCEELKPLPVPAHRPENCFFSRIEVLGGCLAMFSSTDHRSVDVWLMKEYGVEESWTKFSVNTQNYNCLTLPVCLLGDDDLVLQVNQKLFEQGGDNDPLLQLNQKLVVHSLTGETTRDMLVTGNKVGDKLRDVTGFCESLVSPIFYSQK